MNLRTRRRSTVLTLHALLLAACLLAAQWVGVGHRVEHGAFIGVQAAVQARGAHSQHAHEGHAPGSAECLLIDHALAQADAWLPALVLSFGVWRQGAPEPTAAAAVLAAAAVPYLARGPPQARA